MTDITCSWFSVFKQSSTTMKKSLLLLIMIFYLQLDLTVSDPRAELLEFKCGNIPESNLTQFVPNFAAVMANLSDQIRINGFGTARMGTGPDANYGLAQCHPDLSLLDCVFCHADMRGRIPGCFPFNSGHIFLDGCFMRVTNYSFYQEITRPNDTTICGNQTQKDTRFQVSARRALQDAVRDAPLNGGFARPRALVSGSRNESAYVLANCWRTLNASSCTACLESASAKAMRCLPWSEGRVLHTGCFLRYSDRDFLTPVPRTEDSNVSKGVIIAIVLSSAAVALVAAIIAFFIRKDRIIQKKRRGSNDNAKLVKTLNDSRLNFKFSTLQKATDDFSDANKLGQGGFGVVYKGVLADGREIAVKRLFVNNAHRAAEFYNEVNLVSSIEHKNLVRLLGCSCMGAESLLVYEFLENMSLDRFLFDPEKGKTLNWQKRFEIIKGTAEGLVYLHENKNVRIIHRDVKSSNILLDSKLRAKIADFGLARTFQDDKSHISTIIAGTLGYMAPEYLAHGQLTEKADVYSFGILILEIVTGRQNNKFNDSACYNSLIVTAWIHFQEETIEDILDPNLMLQDHNNDGNDVKNDILRVIHVGFLCTQEVPSLRPMMSTVLRMLLKKDEHLPPSTNPPFMDEKTMEFKDVESPSYPLNASFSPSVATMSYSDFYPR